jgi:hypothetical protein
VSFEDLRDRPQRREKRLSGFVRRSGCGIEAAMFDNVSASGCCILGDYKIGEYLVVTIPTLGTVGAQVRWSIGGRAGLRLES